MTNTDSPSPRTPPAPAAAAILVVEDDDLGGRMLISLLGKAGYDADLAHNGRQAIERIEQRQYDLIITDIYMPVMDGIELLRLLRRAGASAPIIAISGGGARVQVDYLDLARRLGACEVLRKPFNRRSLSAAIERALSGGSEAV